MMNQAATRALESLSCGFVQTVGCDVERLPFWIRSYVSKDSGRKSIDSVLTGADVEICWVDRCHFEIPTRWMDKDSRVVLYPGPANGWCEGDVERIMRCCGVKLLLCDLLPDEMDPKQWAWISRIAMDRWMWIPSSPIALDAPFRDLKRLVLIDSNGNRNDDRLVTVLGAVQRVMKEERDLDFSFIVERQLVESLASCDDTAFVIVNGSPSMSDGLPLDRSIFCSGYYEALGCLRKRVLGSVKVIESRNPDSVSFASKTAVEAIDLLGHLKEDCCDRSATVPELTKSVIEFVSGGSESSPDLLCRIGSVFGGNKRSPVSRWIWPEIGALGITLPDMYSLVSGCLGVASDGDIDFRAAIGRFLERPINGSWMNLFEKLQAVSDRFIEVCRSLSIDKPTLAFKAASGLFYGVAREFGCSWRASILKDALSFLDLCDRRQGHLSNRLRLSIAGATGLRLDCDALGEIAPSDIPAIAKAVFCHSSGLILGSDSSEKRKGLLRLEEIKPWIDLESFEDRNSYPWHLSALVHCYSGDVDEALRILREGRRFVGASIADYALLAIHSWFMGRRDQASVFLSLEDISEDWDPMQRFYIAAAFALLGNHGQALSRFTTLAEKHGDLLMSVDGLSFRWAVMFGAMRALGISEAACRFEVSSKEGHPLGLEYHERALSFHPVGELVDEIGFRSPVAPRSFRLPLKPPPKFNPT